MPGAGWRRFQPGEVLTASNLQTYGIDQSVQVYAGTAARGSAIGTATSEGMMSYLADQNKLQLATTSSNWVDVYPSIPATGSVIQVASAIKTNHFFTSSSSYVDITGLSVTITPSSTSSRIAIFANVSFSSVSTSDAIVRLVRNSTEIAGGTEGGSGKGFSQTSSAYSLGTITGAVSFVDLPNTTSATTYKIQILQVGGSGTAVVNRRGSDANFGTSSTIVVMELKY